MGKFIIKNTKSDEYMFNLHAGNGEIILTSEGYKAKDGCKKGIESVRINSQIDARYERKESIHSKFYFVLKAKNGEIIGKSQFYSTRQSMEKGIASVKENAPNAEIVDETL